MIDYYSLPESIKAMITRLSGRLTEMTFQNFEILPGTEDAFTVARKFACLDQELKSVLTDSTSDEYIDANTILDVNFLTIVGPPGCGKTHLTVSTLHSLGESNGVYVVSESGAIRSFS
jgi:DNA replication protein DnaC